MGAQNPHGLVDHGVQQASVFCRARDGRCAENSVCCTGELEQAKFAFPPLLQRSRGWIRLLSPYPLDTAPMGFFLRCS
jgi:hypothetical protein